MFAAQHLDHVCLKMKMTSNVHMTLYNLHFYDSSYAVHPVLGSIQWDICFSLALHTALQGIGFIMINLLCITVHFQKQLQWEYRWVAAGNLQTISHMKQPAVCFQSVPGFWPFPGRAWLTCVVNKTRLPLRSTVPAAHQLSYPYSSTDPGSWTMKSYLNEYMRKQN